MLNKDTVKIAALVSYRIYPAKMGGQKGIALFYQYLSQLLPLTMISVKENEPPAGSLIKPAPLLGHSKWRYINPFLFFKLRKLLRREEITHLVLEHPYYGWLGILLKWATGVKLVIHSHNIEALRFKSIGKWWWGILWHYEKLTHRQAHMNFFIHDEDRAFAISKFKLHPEKCVTITYGITMETRPDAEKRAAAFQQLCRKHQLPEDTRLLLFNGTLDYEPNRQALDIILEKINPVLQTITGFRYRILVCGNRLPAAYDNLAAWQDQNIIYAGFVDDIDLYFDGCAVFLNPVQEGGGIKTKVVEALGHDLFVISTHNGAIGIPAAVTGSQLQLIDDDWNAFALAATKDSSGYHIPPDFFYHFYWGNIARKAAASLGISLQNA